MEDADLGSQLNRFHFYHRIRVNEHVCTPGLDAVTPLVNLTLQTLKEVELQGKRVLDIGCRDGIFCFEAERRGAATVGGIDNDLSRGATEVLIPYLRSRVALHEMNLLDLRPQSFGQFDVVIFAGVLYHLRYPFWCLKLVRDVLAPNGILILETAILIDDNRNALLFCPIGVDSPYEPSSCTFFNVKGLSDTLASLGLTVRHVRHLHPPTPSPSKFAEWKRHLRCLWQPEPPRPLMVDRAVFTCALTPETVNPLVDVYWHGKHRMHSRHITSFESKQ